MIAYTLSRTINNANSGKILLYICWRIDNLSTTSYQSVTKKVLQNSNFSVCIHNRLFIWCGDETAIKWNCQHFIPNTQKTWLKIINNFFLFRAKILEFFMYSNLWLWFYFYLSVAWVDSPHWLNGPYFYYFREMNSQKCRLKVCFWPS